MINIVCVNTGNKYSWEYTEKLYNMVSRNTTVPYKFICITDCKRKSNIEQIILPNATKSWYDKLALFSPFIRNYLYPNPVFFLDLDVVIVDNIDELLSYKGDFIILRDFYRKEGLQSSAMSWNYDFTDKFKWSTKVFHRLGDQGIIENTIGLSVDRWQDLYPEAMVSYKSNCKKGIPKGAKIIHFHGRPKMDKCLTISWVKENWI